MRIQSPGSVKVNKLICTIIPIITSVMIASCGAGGGATQAVADFEATTGSQVVVASQENTSAGTPDLGAALAANTNQEPIIDSISLGCDLVIESIGLSAGEEANFTLFVDDESPLSLTYTIESDDTSISTSSVDDDGVFTLVGLSAGETTMPITVTDDQGLSSQLLLSVIVDG